MRWGAWAYVRTYLEKAEGDTEQDTSQPELIGKLANFGRGTGLEIVHLDSIGLCAL